MDFSTSDPQKQQQSPPIKSQPQHSRKPPSAHRNSRVDPMPARQPTSRAQPSAHPSQPRLMQPLEREQQQQFDLAQKKASFDQAQETSSQQYHHYSQRLPPHYDPHSALPAYGYYPCYSESGPHGYCTTNEQQIVYPEMPQNQQQVYICYCCPTCCQYEAARQAQIHHQHHMQHQAHHLGSHYVDPRGPRNQSYQPLLSAVPDPIKPQQGFLELQSPLKATGMSPPKQTGYETPHDSSSDYHEELAYPYTARILPAERQTSQISQNPTANFASPDAKIKNEKATMRWTSTTKPGGGQQTTYCEDQMGFASFTPGGLSIYSNKKNVIQSDHINSTNKLQFSELTGSEENHPQHHLMPYQQQPGPIGQHYPVAESMCQSYACTPEGFQYRDEEVEEHRVVLPAIQSESKRVQNSQKREQKSAEKLLKGSKSSSSVKLLSNNSISEVKLKRSPTVNLSRRKRRDSDNKENCQFQSHQKPPPPNLTLHNGSVLQEQTAIQEAQDRRKQINLPCNCNKSKCSQNYCQCFINGRECTALCTCSNCENHVHENPERAELLTQQRQKIKQAISVSCRCNMSECQKSYCKCFQANVPCSEKCGCQKCKNTMKCDSHQGPPDPDQEEVKAEKLLSESNLQTPQVLKTSVVQKKLLAQNSKDLGATADKQTKDRLNSVTMQNSTTTSKSGGNQRPRFGEMSDLKPRALASELTKNKASVDKLRQVNTRSRQRKQSSAS